MKSTIYNCICDSKWEFDEVTDTLTLIMLVNGKKFLATFFVGLLTFFENKMKFFFVVLSKNCIVFYNIENLNSPTCNNFTLEFMRICDKNRVFFQVKFKKFRVINYEAKAGPLCFSIDRRKSRKII